MNSKNSKKKRSGNSSKKNSIRKSSYQKSTPPNKNRRSRKITEEHEPFIFEHRAKGSSYRGIADALEEEYTLKVDHTSVFDYFKNRLDGYQKYLLDLKEVRLANAKARILELQQMAEKLGESILDIIENIPKGQWDDIALPALIKQYRELLAQIQDESGDKVHKFKADGITGDFIFGDKTINVFADKTVQARVKETADPGNRFKAVRFSDTGSSLSDN